MEVVMSKPMKQEQVRELSMAFLIPLIAAVVFIPLIVRIHAYDPHLSSYTWFDSVPTKYDVFQYWKSYFLAIAGGIMICMLLIVFFMDKKLPFEKKFIPLGIYALMCILSTFFSVSQYHSTHGFYDMFETIYCLITYCLICYYAFAVIRTEKGLHIAAVWILVGVALLGIIGTSQFFSKDIIMSEIGRKLILPASYGEKHGFYAKDMSLTFGAGRVYCTLYNPNYVGVYTSMVLPLLLVLAVTSGKLLKSICIYVPLIVLTTFSMVGSLSRTGMIALIGSVVLLLVMFYPTILKYWKQSIAIIAVLVIGVVVFDFSRDHIIIDRFMSIFNSESEVETEPLITKIDIQDDCYIVEYKGEELTFINQIEYMTDEEGNLTEEVEAIYPAVFKDDTQMGLLVQETVDENGEAYQYYILDEEGYQDLWMRPAIGGEDSSSYGMQLLADGFSYFIYYSNADNTYYYQNIYGKSTKMIESETADWGIFKMFGGISGRGYIWSKSVPLLKKYLFLGSGPDTYTFAFPQEDYVSLNNGGYSNQIITKPHSMYLQTAIQTGMVSLLAWLIFYFWYFVDSFKLYFRKEYTSFAEKLGVGLMIATASFMISGIANDSNPSTSPIYWGLLGVGIAANAIVKRTRTEEEWKKQQREQAIAKAKAKAQAKGSGENKALS